MPLHGSSLLRLLHTTLLTVSLILPCMSWAAYSLDIRTRASARWSCRAQAWPLVVQQMTLECYIQPTISLTPRVLLRLRFEALRIPKVRFQLSQSTWPGCSLVAAEILAGSRQLVGLEHSSFCCPAELDIEATQSLPLRFLVVMLFCVFLSRKTFLLLSLQPTQASAAPLAIVVDFSVTAEQLVQLFQSLLVASSLLATSDS